LINIAGDRDYYEEVIEEHKVIDNSYEAPYVEIKERVVLKISIDSPEKDIESIFHPLK
jgi:hypothetical protein